MAWVLWDRMAISKCVGGFGFKELEFFNDVFFVKLGWRILNNLEVLLLCVLKGKYFWESFFMESIIK